MTEEESLWADLLLSYGYRPDQLIFGQRGSTPACSLANLPAAAALIQNPENQALNTPEILEQTRYLITQGHLPHHLILLGNSLVQDRDRIDMDCMNVALQKRRK